MTEEQAWQQARAAEQELAIETELHMKDIHIYPYNGKWAVFVGGLCFATCKTREQAVAAAKRAEYARL